MLTATQQDHYWEHGYVLVPDLFAEADIERLDARFVELALGGSPAAAAQDELMIMRDVMVVKGAVAPETPLHGVNKLMNFEGDPQLYAYTIHPQLLAAVRSLIGHDLFSVSTNVFNKPPGVDGRHPLHQDLRYFRFRPADKIVASWTAINPTHRENGCLAVIPGSHKLSLQDHGNPDWDYVNAGFFAIEDINLEDRVHIDMRRGETLLFHPLLIHGSGRNRSTQFRRTISSHFASADCESPHRDWRIGKQARPIG